MSSFIASPRSSADMPGRGSPKNWQQTVRIGIASSTGRRNTGVKFLCRGFKSQGLAWPLIELAGHFVEMGLRVHRQVGSFRKILSQQAIGVLVGTALPWTLRIAKVNIDVGR